MNPSRRRRPVRGLLSTIAVLGLTAAGLAIGFTTAAQAAGEDPRNRDYDVYMRALGTTVSIIDEWNYPIGYFYRNDAQPGASYSYTPDYTWATAHSQTSAGFSNLGDKWQGAANITADGPGSAVKTGHADGDTITGLGTVGEAWSRVEVNQPADGNPTPYGTDIFNTSVTSNPYNLEPQPMTGLATNLDPLDGVTPTTTTTSTRFAPIADTENRAAVEVNIDSGTGTYTALNGTVTIEVVKAVVATSLNSGDAASSASVEGATVHVTGPDGIVHTFDDADGTRQSVTFEDPSAPGVLLTLTINDNSSSITSNGRGAYLWGNAVRGSYTNIDTGSEISRIQIGNLYAEIWAPVGGVNVAPQPDADNDGLTAFEESPTRTSDTVADSDNDGLLDGAEVKVHHTYPKVADTDGDGLNDGLEITLGTDPLVTDTDNDGLGDGREHNTTLTAPTVADTDGDDLTDGREVTSYLTDPLVADTDGDGLTDGQEATVYGTDPLVADADADGLLDGAEIANGTQPRVPDTDNDGLLDGAEVNTYGTSPLTADTDRDKLTDAREVNLARTNPLLADTDGDGLMDGVEVIGFKNKRYGKTFKSNPLKADTDRDGLRDKVEVTGAKNRRFRNAPTNPRTKDTDRDGAADLREIKAKSNPADRRSTPRHP